MSQIDTVAEYQDEFKRLKSILIFKDQHYTKEYFVSGLNGEIKYMVQLFKPATLSDALRLAKMQEFAVKNLAIVHSV